MTNETKKFDAEVGKILHLMIHSLYKEKEIFLRELISNASDACDKLRYLAQTTPYILGEDSEFKIKIHVDKEQRLITIRDNGIGMNKEDLIENLGTIARSGTQNFLNQLSGDSKKDSQLIGQFGVGFYSSYMIADYVTVTSKKAGEDKVFTWYSKGDGEYTVSDTEREFARGCEIVIHVKEGNDEFLDHFRLKHVAKTYSDHVAVPIYFVDSSNNEIQLNSSSALWSRPKSEITEEQYKEFYKNVAYAADEPWLTLHNKNEGAVDFTNLLYIPSTKTFDLFHPDRKRRVKLYVKRVFISDENVDLVPQYLRYLRGVVDSEDLPLNISRESLQHNFAIEKIKNSITKRVLNELKKQKEADPLQYLNFWNNFGGVLKEGLCEAGADHEKILEVSLFKSALEDKMISLDDYIANLKPENKKIYYLSGENNASLQNSPQIEGFLKKNLDVLLFTDAVDDFWVNTVSKYKEYEIISVTRENIDLDNLEETSVEKPDEEVKPQADEKFEKLVSYFKEVLGDWVKDVKISKKLTDSMACLSVAEGAMDIRMEKFLIEQKQLPSTAAKILEINPKHPVIANLIDKLDNIDNQNHSESLVRLVFDMACIVENVAINDVYGFSKRVNDLIQKTVL